VKCVETLKGHHDNVRALCVVDTNLFSASADATIKVLSLSFLPLPLSSSLLTNLNYRCGT